MMTFPRARPSFRYLHLPDDRLHRALRIVAGPVEGSSTCGSRGPRHRQAVFVPAASNAITRCRAAAPGGTARSSQKPPAGSCPGGTGRGHRVVAMPRPLPPRDRRRPTSPQPATSCLGGGGLADGYPARFAEVRPAGRPTRRVARYSSTQRPLLSQRPLWSRRARSVPFSAAARRALTVRPGRSRADSGSNRAGPARFGSRKRSRLSFTARARISARGA
jgi:hypothetical protein